MVLGKTSSAGASYNLEYSRARAYCTGGRCGWGLFGHFYSQLSPLSPSPWETPRYRLKYCFKGPLNPKPTNQPTNQPIASLKNCTVFVVVYLNNLGETIACLSPANRLDGDMH